MKIAQGILIIACMGELLSSDSYGLVYFVIFSFGLFTLYENRSGRERTVPNSRRERVLSMAFALLFSLMITGANYHIWYEAALPQNYMGTGLRILYETLLFLIVSGGSWCAFWNICLWIARKMDGLTWKEQEKAPDSKKIFLCSFSGICILNLTVLFLCKFPGVLTTDSINQIRQIMTGSYSNHHPFYHTLWIKLFLTIGMSIGGINAGVALYSVVQILFMAACFAFAIMTFAQMKIPRGALLLAVAYYALMPYHIMYSFTMWKDVMFGGFVLLFILCMLRCLARTGNVILNQIVLAVSALGMCLFRSNGFFCFVLITLCFLVLFRKEKRLLLIMLCVIGVSFFMKHTVLSALEISQPDTVEALSIPVQQIARAIVEHNDLTEEEREVLGQVAELDRVPEVYLDYKSDPVKALIRASGNQSLITERPEDFIRAYVTIGLRHPMTYVKAWVDQTKGYWNGGYHYWWWSDEVKENDFGIQRTVVSEKLNRLFDDYLWLYEQMPLLQLFVSIGLFVWIDLLMLYVGLIRRDKYGIFLSVPVLTIVLSLLVSTPVYSEFRYVYALFCVLPAVVVAGLRPEVSEKAKEDFHV